MKNNTNIEKSSELSYLDILTQLKKDVNSDVCMPKENKDIANQLINELFYVLYNYSY